MITLYKNSLCTNNIVFLHATDTLLNLALKKTLLTLEIRIKNPLRITYYQKECEYGF